MAVRLRFDDNMAWRRRPQRNRPTGVYKPCQIAANLRTSLRTWDHLKFLDHGRSGVIRLIQLAEGETVASGGCQDRALPAGGERPSKASCSRKLAGTARVVVTQLEEPDGRARWTM